LLSVPSSQRVWFYRDLFLILISSINRRCYKSRSEFFVGLFPTGKENEFSHRNQIGRQITRGLPGSMFGGRR